MKTKTGLLSLAAGVLLFAAGCSSVSSRISRDRAAYETWPMEVREKVAAGQVDIGFTPEQVKVALGEPDRIATRTTAETQSESWIYRNPGPRVSVGFGLGSFSRNSAVGVGVNSGGWALRPDESKRVVFEGGRVAGIEMAARK